MTQGIGNYNLAGSTFDFSGTNEDPTLRITRTQGDEEQTLVIKPAELTGNDRLAYMKLCLQHISEGVEENSKMMKENLESSRKTSESVQEQLKVSREFNKQIDDLELQLSRCQSTLSSLSQCDPEINREEPKGFWATIKGFFLTS